MSHVNAKTRRENNKLTSFIATFPTQLDSTITELFPYRHVFWNHNSSSDALVIPNKIKSAFSNINAPRLKGLLQFWAPAKTPGLLSTSDQPFALEYLDPYFHQYRLCSLTYQYSIDERRNKVEHNQPMIINGLLDAAFLNGFPEIVIDLRDYQGRNPLVDKAMECGLTSLILLPVFYPSENNSSSCVGVVECSMTVSGLSKIFDELKRALERVGFSTYNIQECLPYKSINGLKRATDEIEAALKVVCDSHQLSLAQVWITKESDNTVPCSSSLGGTQTKQMFVVKLCGYCVDSNDNDIKIYCDTCDVLPLKLGEGLAGKTLETNESYFCKNIGRLKPIGSLGLRFSNAKCSVFAICLRNIDTGDLDYAFEFLWSRSRNYLIVVESVLLTLKMCLPGFSFASGAQLGDELRVVDVENSTGCGIGIFKILERNRSSQIPKALEEGMRSVEVTTKSNEKQGPKIVKRNTRNLTESDSPTDYDTDPYWGYDDDISIVAVHRGQVAHGVLRNSYTLANAKEIVEDYFNLDPGSYTMDFECEGEKVILNTDENLAHCIKLWRSAQQRIGKRIQFKVRVLPSSIEKFGPQIQSWLRSLYT